MTNLNPASESAHDTNGVPAEPSRPRSPKQRLSGWSTRRSVR